MRPLTLHVSALSDAEYDLYTASLDDLTDTDQPPPRNDEQTTVGVREARAWLRGRFCDLPASDVDAILKLFCPHMLPQDTLTGGQFFAALRLVVHVESGKAVDRTLAFVQASPKPPKPDSPSKRPVKAPPSHPDRQKPASVSSPETNPFTRRSMEHPTAPVPPPEPDPVHKRASKLSHNPFLARDPVPSNQPKLPPLPPRKPAGLAASPRRLSEAVPTTPANNHTPLIPAKPTHVTSPLMKQSLEASKHAQTVKRAQAQLDRERVLQVLKTTSSSSSVNSSRTRSLSPAKPSQPLPPSSRNGSDDATSVPPLPRRRRQPSLPSSEGSVLSLEQVAHAALPSPTDRPPLPSRETTQEPVRPPTHPHRRPSTSTTTEPPDNDSSPSLSPRVARSKSVTASTSTSPTLPPPPPRRKRPESVQLTPTDLPSVHPQFPPGRAVSYQHPQGGQLSRHLSLTRGKEREPSSDASPMANIQKTLSNLQLKAQPKLDAVRYKAEAGISKRGYVHHGGFRWREEGEEGLMADTRWAAPNVDRDPDSEPTTDEESNATRSAGTAPYRDLLTESDNLKWPMGNGWKPL